ncbi:hypothetical protein BJX65DRAFT_304069 [Aspergillus insuetus]
MSMTQTTLLKYTTQSCLACKVKKRKCDKRLPTCSRCRRSKNQQCLYGSGLLGFYGNITPVTADNGVKIQSTTLGAVCVYDHLSELELLRTHHSFSYTLTREPSKYTPLYPIEFQDHIPMLLRFFQDKMGLLPFQVKGYTLASYLRSSWISSALTDPCLFHATLFSASVQLDALTGVERSNHATLYHQANTVRLVRSRLAASTGTLDDATVASTLLLAIHGSLLFDDESTEIHRRGLLQMVATRGGLDNLGFEGFLAELIQNSMSFLAIIFDQPDPFPIAEWASFDAPLLPHGLVSLVLQGLSRSPSPSLSLHLNELFHDIQGLVHEVCSDPGAMTPGAMSDTRLHSHFLDNLRSRSKHGLTTQSTALSKKELALLRTCSLSGTILVYLLDTRIPWSDNQMTQLLATLEAEINTTERSTWLMHCPEAVLWISAVGAAMSDDLYGRKRFILKEKCVASSIRPTRPSVHIASWFGYRWLKDRRLVRCGGAA